MTMLARAGITREAIADPGNRVPYQALVTLLHEAAHETACHTLVCYWDERGISLTLVWWAKRSVTRRRSYAHCKR